MVRQSKNLIAGVKWLDGEVRTIRDKIAREFLGYFKSKWNRVATTVDAHSLVQNLINEVQFEESAAGLSR